MIVFVSQIFGEKQAGNKKDEELYFLLFKISAIKIKM